MKKEGTSPLQDDNLQGHNAELINAKFCDTLNDDPGDITKEQESDTVTPKIQKQDSPE